ncbi:zinc finger protein OZF-like isoform X2 [Diorhabda sublineata]|uniref:zinc finger protein OZF-like isoform X2 n=1 Tax=Diorhabda sublineata TaxID=1163346 RepID=UPI0024E0EAD4|nr:zinc finger protein OZF-like isoform X2 [Diorhabda sublineata]
MEVKQELEDIFIEEQKFNIEEHNIKQENDAYYLQQTCDDVKIKIKEMIYDDDLECKLETDGMLLDVTNYGDNFNASSSIESVNDQSRLLFKRRLQKNLKLFTYDQINCLKEGTLSRQIYIKLEGIFICKFCGNLYAKKFDILHHNFRHFVKKSRRNVIKKQRRLKCNFSLMPFSKTTSLVQHLRNRSIYPKFFSISIGDISNDNVQKHTVEKPLNSDISPKSLTASTSLVENINKKPFKCDVCLKTFSQKFPLNRHMLSHTEEKPFKCDVCFKTFSEKHKLKTHFLSHTKEKPFKCDICLKTFSQKFSLNRHLLSHTGEKPFKCDICLKTFSEKHKLKIHFLSHTKEKPFKCDVCLKTFSQKFSLNRHLLSHTEEKPFKCEVCFKTFSEKHKLKIHFLSHTKEKPFKCDVCSKTFPQKFSLNRHLLSHTEEKPFKCDICSKTFSEKHKLKIHFPSHTREKPFKCDV